MNNEIRNHIRAQGVLSVVVLLVVLGSVFLLSSDAWAAPTHLPDSRPVGQVDPDLLKQAEAGVADLSFAELGGETMIFRPRYSQESFVFELPYRWNIQPGSAYIDLVIDVINNSSGARDLLEVDPGVLELYVDGTVVGSFVTEPGLAQVVRIDLPVSAFNSLESNQHVITFAYTSRVRCTIDDVDPTRVVVRDNSRLHFDFSLQEERVDLADFPRPIYRSLVGTEHVLIVIPDEYTSTDLEAAASIAATIGSTTFGEMEVMLRQASDVTVDLAESMPLVILGTPTSNTLLSDLYASASLPTDLTNDGSIRSLASGQVAGSAEGVIQEARSGFNNEYINLILTGETPEGGLLASRALSSLDPRFGLTGPVSIIAETGEFSRAYTDQTTTLSALGLRLETLEEFGVRLTQVNFFVRSNWIFDQNAMLNLEYRHSANLNSGASSLNVLLNGAPVASLKLQGASTTTGQVVIELPVEDLQPGRNQLTFLANLELEDPCAETTTDTSWVRVFGESTLDLDYRLSEQNILGDLEDPLEPFYSTLDLSDVHFVLPEEPATSELEGMVQLAWLMGESTSGGGFAPSVSLNTIEDSARDEVHIMAIGRPTTNEFVNEIGSLLYQPFVPGEDTILQEIGNVTYRLPERFSLGLIQTIRAPWNENRAITVVAGTTPEGQEWALRSLVSEEPYASLTFVSQDRLESFDGQELLRGAVGVIEGITGETVDLDDLQATPQPTPDVDQITGSGSGEGQSEYPGPVEPSRVFLIASIALVAVGLIIVILGVLWRRIMN